jgi:hypothetical protein
MRLGTDAGLVLNSRTPPNQPLQRMCACPARSNVRVCRDAAGWRPRLLATVLRSNATVGAHR